MTKWQSSKKDILIGFLTIIVISLSFSLIAYEASARSKKICSQKLINKILENISRESRISSVAKLKLYREAYSIKNLQTIDGVFGNVFRYSWDPRSIFLNISDSSLSEKKLYEKSLYWSKHVGLMCPQVEVTEFNVGGGNLILSSYKNDGFSTICPSRNTWKKMSCR